MEADDLNRCPVCGAQYGRGDPFCHECGRLLPSVALPGDVSVDMLDVPSEKLRQRIVGLLRSWFPDVDAVEADRRLKAGKSRLISGIDADSARRIVDALKAEKAGAGLTRDKSRTGRFINGGLIVSAIALIAAPFLSLSGSIFMLLLAVAAPIAGAMLKQERMRPLVPSPADSLESAEWIAIAKQYSELVPTLEASEAESLRFITKTVFGLRRRLSQPTLAATAAGEVAGDLYQRLHDAIRTALEICRRISSGNGEIKEAHNRELDGLKKLVAETADWFRAHEHDNLKEFPQLADELRGIRESIDSVLKEVRPSESGSRAGKIAV